MHQNTFNIADYILALAQKPNAKENIALLLDSLFNLSEKEKQEAYRKEKAASSIVFFTSRELCKMPLPIRKLFKDNKACAHIAQRNDGLYLIRCQINNTRITVTGKNLNACKDKFLSKVNNLGNDFIQNKKKKILFENYIQNWLETAKKPFIKNVTYKGYIQTINAYLLPKFKNRTIESIQYFELQNMLTEISESGRNCTAKKIYQILSPLFEYAVADGIILRSPMAKVKLARYEQTHGVPLTREEEFTLLQEIKLNPTIYNQAYAFIMYTGLRRSELASVEIDGEWINLITAKQRKGMKDKHRSIPISPMLKQVLPFIDIEKIKTASVGVLTNRFKNVCPNHHLHDLRHTFITRAQECGIRREIVSLWSGHKADSSITTNVYTHFQEHSELQILEIKKYNYTYAKPF